MVSMIALLKYGCGVPFHRLERLQNSLGIPVPAGTQWMLVAEAVQALLPVWTALVKEAANGDILHNDDTVMRILQLNDLELPASRGKGKNLKERTGVFTTGIIVIKEERKIALFYTGRKQAGENLTDVLKKRAKELEPPIQMCDALNRNTTGNRDGDEPLTEEASCMAHARREFVD
ncbi:MAG: transposase, partial [Myxococcota bacterium]